MQFTDDVELCSKAFNWRGRHPPYFSGTIVFLIFKSSKLGKNPSIV